MGLHFINVPSKTLQMRNLADPSCPKPGFDQANIAAM